MERSMEFLKEMMSNATSMVAYFMLVQSILNQLLPPQVRRLILSLLDNFFPRVPTLLSMVIEEYSELAVNELYVAAEAYLSTKISSANNLLKVGKSRKESGFLITLGTGEKVVDVFDGVKIIWKVLVCTEATEKRASYSYEQSSMRQSRHRFELSFNKIHMDKVLNSYFPHILDRAKAIKEGNTKLRIYTTRGRFLSYSKSPWHSAVLDHPSTFETLAMEEAQKAALMNDLKKFVERKQLYRHVGKAWKRGYLLYGPPGTGKSSLIAAMANFLNFDIYDLELTDVRHNSGLQNLLMATSNKSILVIEDIDCTKELMDRKKSADQDSDYRRRSSGASAVTLSGFLNFIDGLWSSCGDERIIIFTTNHREKLDPALLRAGRMDMHIHMGYCSFSGFRTLAFNYLGIHDHPLFEDIRYLLQKVQITPAEIGEEFLRSQVDNPTAALQSLIDASLRKKRENERDQEENGEEHVEDKVSTDHGGKQESEKTEKKRELSVGAV